MDKVETKSGKLAKIEKRGKMENVEKMEIGKGKLVEKIGKLIKKQRRNWENRQKRRKQRKWENRGNVKKQRKREKKGAAVYAPPDSGSSVVNGNGESKY